MKAGEIQYSAEWPFPEGVNPTPTQLQKKAELLARMLLKHAKKEGAHSFRRPPYPPKGAVVRVKCGQPARDFPIRAISQYVMHHRTLLHRIWVRVDILASK